MIRPKADRSRFLVGVPVSVLTEELRALALRSHLVDDDGFVHIKRQCAAYPKQAKEVFSQDGKIKRAV